MIKILIIGGGNMGESLASSCFNNKAEIELSILEKNNTRKKQLVLMGYQVFSDIKSIKNFDYNIILFAFKPNNTEDFFKEIKQNLSDEIIYLSIMAGVSIEKLMSFGLKKVIRLMPNMATSINEGVVGAFASKNVSEAEKNIVYNYLSLANLVIWLKNEDMIDKITSISGSGPAYVFSFMNAMYEKAVEFGFDDFTAKTLVNKTFSGALKISNSSELNYTDLINKVKSKGGTTEAALDEFERLNLENTIQNGISEALKRAKKLSV